MKSVYYSCSSAAQIPGRKKESMLKSFNKLIVLTNYDFKSSRRTKTLYCDNTCYCLGSCKTPQVLDGKTPANETGIDITGKPNDGLNA